MNNIVRFASLFVWIFLSFYLYYIWFAFHGEEKQFFWIYIIFAFIIYGIYKLIEVWFKERESWIWYLKIVWFFVFQLLLLSMMFFSINGLSVGLGILLTFKILWILIIISGLWLCFMSLGQKILDICNIYREENTIIKSMAWLWVGFFVFMLWIFILAFVGLYNIYWILVWLFLCFWFSINQSIKNVWDLTKFYISEEHNDPVWIPRIINEILLWIITFFLSINFVSVFRPFPIGWDDLWVYMNFPKLISQAGELLPLWKMYTWELYTGMWFIFGSQTLAFFLNSFAGLSVALIAYMSLNYILWKYRYYFSLPLLWVVILLMLPMWVFQLAKDMKLDYGLLTFSIISFTLLYHQIIQKSENILGETLKRFFVIWLLIWLVFAIKVTSLLLLISALWMYIYKRMWVLWFTAYFSLFVWVFTLWNLWKLMNVIIEVPYLIKLIIAWVFIFWGLSLLYVSYKKDNQNSKYFKDTISQVWILILGFIVALIPWTVQHISEAPNGAGISIWSMISWYSADYIPEYSNIYTSEEIQNIQNQYTNGISSSWTTNNEDFWRYFGYEKGINNYLKLPFNLTFQLNQKGEFTDISFVFFALLPLLFLFLAFKRNEYLYVFAWLICMTLVYYIPSPISNILTSILWNISLPVWYLLIAAFYFIPFYYLHFSIKKDQNEEKMFLLSLSFLTIYLFLWAISAFWIVWYGILMYFLFVLIIMQSVVSYENKLEKQNPYNWFLSYSVLWVIALYLLSSAIPHGITNLVQASYSEYKLWQQTEESAVFQFHPDYFPVLFNLNIAPEDQEPFFIEYRNRLLDIIDTNDQNSDVVSMIQNIEDIERLFLVMTQISKNNIEGGINIEVEKILQEMYQRILYPKEENKNKNNIYRVGTFLKYFVSQNNSRMFEDSLLNAFEEYIYDEDNNVTYERFKKLDLSYILLDLNAATIDQDPAKNLTVRYEHLLSFLNHPKVELVNSDSVCLKLAQDIYDDTENSEMYLKLAWVNYGTSEEKQEKLTLCLTTISDYISQNMVTTWKYRYLLPYKNLIDQSEIDSQNATVVAQTLAPYMQMSYKAFYKIND